MTERIVDVGRKRMACLNWQLEGLIKGSCIKGLGLVRNCGQRGREVLLIPWV